MRQLIKSLNGCLFNWDGLGVIPSLRASFLIMYLFSSYCFFVEVHQKRGDIPGIVSVLWVVLKSRHQDIKWSKILFVFLLLRTYFLVHACSRCHFLFPRKRSLC